MSEGTTIGGPGVTPPRTEQETLQQLNREVRVRIDRLRDAAKGGEVKPVDATQIRQWMNDSLSSALGEPPAPRPMPDKTDLKLMGQQVNPEKVLLSVMDAVQNRIDELAQQAKGGDAQPVDPVQLREWLNQTVVEELNKVIRRSPAKGGDAKPIQPEEIDMWLKKALEPEVQKR